MFLDWRPVGATPIADRVAVRERIVLPAKLAPYVQRNLSYVPKFEAFRQAAVLARADGIFVLRLEFHPGAAFDEENLDELALAACMAAKEELGHRHDVHSPKPLAKSSGLEPAEILLTYPVRVDEEFWRDRFEAKDFCDRDLRGSECVPPPNVNANETPRNALICLRRAYFKVFEVLQSHLDEDRKTQLEWERSWVPQIQLVGASSALFLLFLYVALAVGSGSWDSPDMRLTFCVAAFVLLPCFWGFLYQFAHFVYFDRRRIRLLRAAETFYSYANPLNEVIARALGAGKRRATSDFAALHRILQSKSAGEIHRGSVRQFWMTLSMAFGAIVFAALAIRTEVRRQPHAASLTASRLDCGAPIRSIGPFVLGAWDRLEPGAATPEELARELSLRDKEGLVVLVGSADSVRVRALSPLEANSVLAQRRAAWAVGRLRAALARPGWEVAALNESMPFARMVLEPETRTTGREVIICVED